MKVFKLLLFVILLAACSSDDDCTKTIQIPQVYFYNNQSYSYNITQEVSCDFPEPETVEVDPPQLEGFTYEVLSFVYTPDTGNNTSRLQFEIKLKNPNNFSINGFPVFTLLSDNMQFSTNYGSLLSQPCDVLNANSDCIVTLDVQENHIIGYPNSLSLLDVKYYLTN